MKKAFLFMGLALMSLGGLLPFIKPQDPAVHAETAIVRPAEPVVQKDQPKPETKPVATKKAVVIEKPKPKPAVVAPKGNCASWMEQAGITDKVNALWLINKESSCNPNAINPSSGACGIGQQLPCGKWPHTWNEPVGAMKDMQSYVFDRYGSWANAVNFHRQNGWY